MTKEIAIDGCVIVPEELSEDNFWELFINFIEANHWSFGGGIKDLSNE